MSTFFIPGSGDDRRLTGRAYADMRVELERDLGTLPNPRRIAKLWSQRGSTDCVTEVGRPDPLHGGVVLAIFDMGPPPAVRRLVAAARSRADRPAGDPWISRIRGGGVRRVSSDALELAQTEARYYRDRVALLRAKLYRSGVGSTPRLQQLERQLQRAEQRLSEVRSDEAR